MASLLDDLKGILGDDAIAKIEANPALKSRVEKGSELVTMYYGDEETDPAPAPARTTDPAPVPRSVPGAHLDLSAVERMLDTKLGTISTTIDTKLGEVIQKRGDELVNNAVKLSVQRTDQLLRLYSRATELTGKPLDSVAFNEFLEKDENKGKFRSIEEAGEAFLAPVAKEKEIEAEVTKRVAAKSGSNVPGTTPAPSTNNTIAFFRKRGTAAEGGATTGAQRAAALLDQKLNAGAA